jgi:2-polyprenyl-6-hydroxyphenyl methylase / 3-demethylubiquinone-9 3-methyltransferase
MIKLSQDWSATAWAEPDLHEFDMFIRPEELEAHLEQAGLEVRDRVGFAAANPAAAVKAMWDRGHGKITYREMGERLGIKESRDTSSSYGGYALKRRPAA